MELRQLQTFTQIAQMQSFSRTAEMLGYSQSAVTVQIRQLENEFEVDVTGPRDTWTQGKVLASLRTGPATRISWQSEQRAAASPHRHLAHPRTHSQTSSQRSHSYRPF